MGKSFHTQIKSNYSLRDRSKIKPNNKFHFEFSQKIGIKKLNFIEKMTKKLNFLQIKSSKNDKNVSISPKFESKLNFSTKIKKNSNFKINLTPNSKKLTKKSDVKIGPNHQAAIPPLNCKMSREFKKKAQKLIGRKITNIEKFWKTKTMIKRKLQTITDLIRDEKEEKLLYLNFETEFNFTPQKSVEISLENKENVKNSEKLTKSAKNIDNFDEKNQKDKILNKNLIKFIKYREIKRRIASDKCKRVIDMVMRQIKEKENFKK